MAIFFICVGPDGMFGTFRKKILSVLLPIKRSIQLRVDCVNPTTMEHPLGIKDTTLYAMRSTGAETLSIYSDRRQFALDSKCLVSFLRILNLRCEEILLFSYK